MPNQRKIRYTVQEKPQNELLGISRNIVEVDYVDKTGSSGQLWLFCRTAKIAGL